MGVVYRAERQDLGSIVAIKILRHAWLSPARRELAGCDILVKQLNPPARWLDVAREDLATVDHALKQAGRVAR